VTARREFELSCDGPPGAGPFDCPTAPVFDRTIAAVRRTAEEQGWERRIRAGKVVDLCPDHKDAPKPPVSRGECAVCGKDCRLTLDGLIFSHKRPNRPGERWPPRCAGMGKPPKSPTVQGAGDG